MTPEIDEFRKSGKYLPDILKDFHDQKDLFKTVFEMYGSDLKSKHPELNFVNTQIFTIDYLLWFLAAHGYGIRKIRKGKIEFKDIHETLRLYKDHRINNAANILNNLIPTNQAVEK